MKILQTYGLSKNYGRIAANRNISLTIEEGQVFGLLGPNGSGKTTFLSVVLGIAKASNGSFVWNENMDPLKARQQIGAIIEKPCFYPYLSGLDNLKIICRLRNVPLQNAYEVLEQVNLIGRERDKFKTYSLGMKQRLAIAAALVHKPKVLLLDEPTNGLDPEGIIEIRDLILDIRKQGMSIILASHLLDEVQKVCTHFCILKKGEMIYQGAISDTYTNSNVFRLKADDMEALEQALQRIENIEFHKEDKGFEVVATEIGAAQLNEMLYNKGVILSELQQKQNNLEDKFLEVVKQKSE